MVGKMAVTKGCMMALTKEDLGQIKVLVKDVVEDAVRPIRGDIDDLAKATSDQFAEIITRLDHMDESIAELKDDMAVVKDIVKDHSFRIARIEHHINPAS